MERTPKALRFVRNVNEDNTISLLPKSNVTSNITPVKKSKKPRIWETDIYSQESDDIDVAWDWDSPKNIKPKTVHKAKTELRKSPKLPQKKASQVDHLKNFEKLREELQALRNEIARVDDDCLPLSLDEQTFREESAKESNDINSFIEEQYFHIENQETENLLKVDVNLIKNEHNASVDDLFDGSSDDEQLILCTQTIEEKLKSKIDTIGTLACKTYKHTNLKDKIHSVSEMNICRFNSKEEVFNSSEPSVKKVIGQNQIDIRSTQLEKKIMNTVSHSVDNNFEKNILCKSADDSFDAVLKDFEDEDLDIITQTNNNNNEKTFIPRKFQGHGTNLGSSFKRTFSDANVQYSPKNVESVKVSKFTFHRTHSFESAATKEDDLPKHVMAEIERKRNEALVRLKEKKERDKYQLKTVEEIYSNISPLKCSPEEIEQKRLQAQAIRNAKRKEIMERNRLEALKRLEINRQKRLGNNFKSIQDKVIK